MPIGEITGYIDVAQVALYVFWVFFAGLIFYLLRENKREGYPLESDRSDKVVVQGFPPVPPTKEYLLADGSRVIAGGRPDTREVRAEPVGAWPGAPLIPTGDPMLDGVGPAAYAERADHPDVTTEGHPRIVPMRVAGDFSVVSRDPDPRGMQVIAGDGKVAGTVEDVWVDRAEVLIRYLEVAVADSEEPRRVLVPMPLVRIRQLRSMPTDGSITERVRGKQRPREAVVKSVMAHHFAKAPLLRNPDQVTLLEEDKISAFFGGGHMYANASRQEPLI